MKNFSAILLFCVALLHHEQMTTVALVPLTTMAHGKIRTIQSKRPKRSGTTNSDSRSSLISLEMSSSNNNNNMFDISKPTFDWYSLRNIRGDALLRYNSLNQSEPLRINLYLIAMFTLFAYPTLSEAVLEQPAPLAGVAASALAGVFAGYRFVRECSRRNRKLTKMEKELNAQSLQVRLPSSSILADRPFQPTAFSVQQVLSKKRILAISGPNDVLKDALITVQALRQRFVQANVLIVPIVASGDDSSSSSILDLMDTKQSPSMPYLAEPVNGPEWTEYFRSLIGDDDDEDSSISSGQMRGNELVWFGLSNSGKSFGSGVGTPRWLEILGQSLLPMEVLDVDDKDSATDDTTSKEVLTALQEFYSALTGGSLEGIEQICAPETSDQVQEVLDLGGSLDNWELCLADGARPEGMKVSGSDVWIVSDTLAYSTTIEFPKEPSGGGFGGADPTLLAVQQWTRPNKEQSWKLQLHQTIPWGPDSRAGATLRCDCRGCTALASGPAREWNFRGMID